jgi:hypothetical protein
MFIYIVILIHWIFYPVSYSSLAFSWALPSSPPSTSLTPSSCQSILLLHSSISISPVPGFGHKSSSASPTVTILHCSTSKTKFRYHHHTFQSQLMMSWLGGLGPHVQLPDVRNNRICSSIYSFYSNLGSAYDPTTGNAWTHQHSCSDRTRSSHRSCIPNCLTLPNIQYTWTTTSIEFSIPYRWACWVCPNYNWWWFLSPQARARRDTLNS